MLCHGDGNQCSDIISSLMKIKDESEIINSVSLFDLTCPNMFLLIILNQFIHKLFYPFKQAAPTSVVTALETFCDPLHHHLYSQKQMFESVNNEDGIEMSSTKSDSDSGSNSGDESERESTNAGGGGIDQLFRVRVMTCHDVIMLALSLT